MSTSCGLRLTKKTQECLGLGGSAGAPHTGFTAQVHEARAPQTTAHLRLRHHCACLVRLSREQLEALNSLATSFSRLALAKPLSRPSSRSLSHQAFLAPGLACRIGPQQKFAILSTQLKPGEQEARKLECIFSGSREPTATGSPLWLAGWLLSPHQHTQTHTRTHTHKKISDP